MLVVHCHPDPGSFVSSLAGDARRVLDEAGHEVRFLDLHGEGFDPVFTLHERLNHTGPAAEKRRKSIRYRPDVDLALSAGFTEDEVRFMLDLPEDGEAR